MNKLIIIGIWLVSLIAMSIFIMNVVWDEDNYTKVGDTCTKVGNALDVSDTKDKPLVTPTLAEPTKSECDMAFDGIREFENVQMRFMSYTFNTSGEIEQIDDTYYVKCGGWNDDGRVYAIIVNEVIYGEDYGLIIIQHGHGSIDYDYEINDRKLEEMINKSTPAK